MTPGPCVTMAGASMVAGRPTEKFQPVEASGAEQPVAPKARARLQRTTIRRIAISFRVPVAFPGDKSVIGVAGSKLQVISAQELRAAQTASVNQAASVNPVPHCEEDSMTPELTFLAVGVGLLVVGAILRGHAPKLWAVLAPVFGAAESAMGVPQTPPPPAPPAAGAPTGSPTPPLPPSLLATLSRPKDPEEELEIALDHYLRATQRGRRIAGLMAQVERGASKAYPPPAPSVN